MNKPKKAAADPQTQEQKQTGAGVEAGKMREGRREVRASVAPRLRHGDDSECGGRAAPAPGGGRRQPHLAARRAEPC